MDDGADDTSACAAYRYRWDVFLSFRGVDTRKGFVAGLYDELERRDVRAFRDDEGTERGDEITPTILAAIEDSAAAIAVISENYANSKGCLDELATIFERRKLVVPVFYGVDPSDVRRQKGSFEAEFQKYEQDVGPGKVKRWKNAMNRAGNISGLDSRFGQEESEIIEILVKRVLKELNNTPLGVAKYPIGLDTRLEVYLEKLDVKSNDVRIIGFYGMGGIGKTTLAKALFNKLIVHFKKRSFISNVREESQKPNGLESLQAKLLADFNSSKPISDTGKGILYIKQITHNESVLIVLDDIDSSNQLHALAGGRDWFHGGSRIIITGRDKRNFPNYVHDYEVNKLTDDESVRLFSYHALGQEQPTQDIALITKHIVSLTGGLPLALEVFGSSLFYKRSKKEWVDSYEKLQKVRPGNLQDILGISFESLDEEERRVFLDLACFFVSMKMKRDDVVDIFKGCGFNAESTVTELTGKSLVRVVDGNELWMHDQLREMGKEIVRQEDYVDCGQRSRLWDRDEILKVLKNEKGTRKIEGIILDFSRKHDSAFAISDSIKPQASFEILECLKNYILHICQGKEKEKDDDDDDDDETVLLTKSFKPMLHLRLLQINNAKLDEDFKFLPAELKWLQWKGCPLKTLPPEFHLQQDLAVLDLSESQICQLWSQRWWDSHGRKMGKKLIIVNLYACHLLKEIPDLSGLSLEKMIFEHCSSLVTIHKSLGDMSKLTHLNLKECTNLVQFPSDVSRLECLETLFLSGCRKLRDLPKDMSGLKSLKEFLLDRTAITELPISIRHLKNLEILNLDHCEALTLLPFSIGDLKSLRNLSLRGSALREIPEEIGQLKNLEKLNLDFCKSLSLLPCSIGDLKSLTELNLGSTAIKELPVSIDLLCNLKRLSMGRCANLSHLPDSICKLSSLVSLSLKGMMIREIPDEIGALSALESLDVSNCQSIQSLPASIGDLSNLTELDLNNLTIHDLPDSLGSLGRLAALRLNNCKNLQRLPTSIGKLKDLRYLYAARSGVIELPVEIGTLSNLFILKLRKDVNSELACVENDFVLPDSFSGLSMLENLDFHGCKISGKIPDDIGRLSCLQSLDFSYNSFTSLPSSLSGLSMLKILLLPHCEELKTLPPLPDSLFRLNVANCFELELMPDVSNLGSLEELELTNCRKVVDIPGLEKLKSLRRLYTGGCEACLSSIQKRLSKEALRYISYLCVPGSEIPDWFVQEVHEFSWPKNRELKGVIIALVVSLDQHAQENGFRDMVPVIVDIQAKIIRRNKIIFTTTPNLRGVPNTDQHQLYLCHYHDYDNLLLVLEHGDALQLATPEKPYFPGMTLEKHGIHLVFENDDDYDECDEALLNESEQSVSTRLSNFFTSLCMG